MIKEEMKKGMSVAVLDYGDPTIWSGSGYIREYIEEDKIDMVPGLSSFNVANAMLKKHIGCNGSIILTTSRGIMENRSMFEAAAKHGETLCLFMGIKELSNLIGFFNGCYPEKTPVHLVYRAGYMGSEKVVKTDLQGLELTVGKEPEKHLVLIYIGPCVESKKAMKH